jgi:hypothetical protein
MAPDDYSSTPRSTCCDRGLPGHDDALSLAGASAGTQGEQRGDDRIDGGELVGLVAVRPQRWTVGIADE